MLTEIKRRWRFFGWNTLRVKLSWKWNRTQQSTFPPSASTSLIFFKTGAGRCSGVRVSSGSDNGFIVGAGGCRDSGMLAPKKASENYFRYFYSSEWNCLYGCTRCDILLPSGGEEGFVVCSRRANTDSIKPPPQMRKKTEGLYEMHETKKIEGKKNTFHSNSKILRNWLPEIAFWMQIRDSRKQRSRWVARIDPLRHPGLRVVVLVGTAVDGATVTWRSEKKTT